jgi:signal transduction histidine kinase
VDIEGDEPGLDDAVKITIFRIVQESLNNIIKHSKATNVNVKLDYREKEARILVRDNGLGFDLDRVQNRAGRVSLGLAGMEERAMLLGGRVEVHSRPNYGTEVEAVIPYVVKRVEVVDDTTSVGG